MVILVVWVQCEDIIKCLFEMCLVFIIDCVGMVLVSYKEIRFEMELLCDRLVLELNLINLSCKLEVFGNLFQSLVSYRESINVGWRG